MAEARHLSIIDVRQGMPIVVGHRGIRIVAHEAVLRKGLFEFMSSPVSSEKPKGFPYLTGREQAKMVLYRPRFRHPDRAAKPSNLAEAEKIGPGLNPVCADPADLGAAARR